MYKHTQRLDEQRAQSLADPDVLKRFYALIAHQIHLYRIQPSQLFNCDEKGIIMGRATAHTKGIVDATAGRRRRHYARGNSNRESATALKTISAAGTVLPPFFVLNGARHSVGWYTDLAEEEATFAVQANATMDIELGMAYMADHFDKYSATVASGSRGYRMLIVDGHKSHMSWQVVQYCLDHRIRLLCLPPHSTHELQPLDVGVFSSLQGYYGDAVNDWIYEHDTGGRDKIRKVEFLHLYLQARKKAFTPECIRQAFRSTGIYPLNP